MRVIRVIRVGVRMFAVGVRMPRAVRMRVAVVVDQPLHDDATARQVPVPIVMPREVSERADDEQRRDQSSEGVGMPHNHPVSISRTCRGAPAKPWITGSSLRGALRSHTLAKRYSPSRQTASVTFSTVSSSATRGQR